MWLTFGAARCRDAGSEVGSPGSGSSRSLMTGFLSQESFIRGRSSVLPSGTRGRSRMPELGSYRSVRGAAGNSRPYRDCRHDDAIHALRRPASEKRQGIVFMSLRISEFVDDVLAG